MNLLGQERFVQITIEQAKLAWAAVAAFDQIYGEDFRKSLGDLAPKCSAKALVETLRTQIEFLEANAGEPKK